MSVKSQSSKCFFQRFSNRPEELPLIFTHDGIINDKEPKYLRMKENNHQLFILLMFTFLNSAISKHTVIVTACL